MYKSNQYTDEYILDRLQTHLVDNMGSIYSMSKPTWQGVMKRMAKDENFADAVKDCQADALWKWEKKGLDNIEGSNPDFNTGLFKLFVQNKKSFMPPENSTPLDVNIEVVQK